jgi:hypothetical protein
VSPTRVTALDLATVSGVCFGTPGTVPTFQTWDLSRVKGRGARGVEFMRKLLNHIEVYRPELVGIEQPMRPQIMVRLNSSQDVQMFLVGIVVLAETVCASRGIPTTLIDPQQARQHFVGQARFPEAKQGKAAVMKMCKVLRWSPENDNESDAGCLWDHLCAQQSPAAFLAAAVNRPHRGSRRHGRGT